MKFGARGHSGVVVVSWLLKVALLLFLGIGHQYSTAVRAADTTAEVGGCGFLHTEPRYYQVTSMLTLQNVPGNDIFVNDALVRTLRRQLLVAECQVSLSEGAPCVSGTEQLPCAEPVHKCPGMDAATGSLLTADGSSFVLTNDVYKAIVDESCDSNGDGVTDTIDSVNMLVCGTVATYGPGVQSAVKRGACKAVCTLMGAPENMTSSVSNSDTIENCLSFDLILSTPTAQAADVLQSELLSSRIKNDVELSMSGFGNTPLIFSVVDSSVGPAVGFGFFPPPPPPPPPVKQLAPLPTQGGDAASSDLQLVYGEWSPCYPSCGDGISTRTATCIDKEGAVLALKDCPGGLYAETSKQCSTECQLPYWQYGPWQTCSKRCGTGQSIRTAKCVSDGTTACSEAEKEPLSRECNTIPCDVFSWVESEWSACSAPCGGGTQSRNVSCVSSTGETASETSCVQDVRPPNSRNCNQESCNFCGSTICLGRGTCSDSTCQCNKGYAGKYCEVHQSCESGVVDTMLECCQSGVLNSRGECCEEGSSLDGTGECCAGQVDACGVCNGNANFIDIQGKCCAVVDADGVCCSSGMIDECGVCNGVGNTCNILLGLKMKVPADLIADGSIQEASINSYLAQVANISGIDQSRISIGSISPAPSARRRARQLLQTEDTEVVIVEVEIAPDENQVMDVPFSSAYYAAALPEASAKYGSQKFAVENVPISSRSGVCGNGICEVGERATVDVTPGTCSQDCGLPSKVCDGGCGSNGFCQPASGICMCLSGYEGPSCDMCSHGYVLGADGVTCILNVAEKGAIAPVVLGDNGQALVSGQSSSSSSAGVIVGAVIGSLLGVALLVLLFIYLRKRMARPVSTLHQPRRSHVLDNGEYYPGDDSDEFGLRKKYGMSPYNFGYTDSDQADTIQTGVYQQDDPVIIQHVQQQDDGYDLERAMTFKSTHSMPGYAEIIGMDSQNIALERPISAKVSYATQPTDAPTTSSDMYIKKPSECITDGDEQYIPSAPQHHHGYDSPEHGEQHLQEEGDTSGAHSLAIESPASINEVESLGHVQYRANTDVELQTSLGSESRLFFNPAFSLRPDDGQQSCAEAPDSDSKTMVVIRNEEDDLAMRRRKLDALRAAVRSLESRAPSEASFQSASVDLMDPPQTHGEFLPGRPHVPGLDLSSKNKNKPPAPAPAAVPQREGIFATMKRALTPPRFRKCKESNAVTKSQESFNRVMNAVNGALREPKAATSRFNAQQYQDTTHLDTRPPWH
jgi:hypothetical protein